MYWALYYSKIKRQITMYKIYISYREWLVKCKTLFVNIIFQKLLKKLISKSPQLAPHMYIHVSCEPRFHFTVFLFFVFFKLECRDFTRSTTNLLSISQTDLKSNCCTRDKDCTCLNGRHWMSEDVAQDQNPKNCDSEFNVQCLWGCNLFIGQI